MDEELYFHRCFVGTKHLPRFRRKEKVVTTVALELFVEEAIEYVFTYNDICDWDPPNSIKELKAAIPQQIYFHPYIGLAINHQCVVDDTLRLAEEGGFVVDQWLQLPSDEAKEHIDPYLEIVRVKAKPVNLSIIYMLAFTTLLSRLAMQRDRSDLVIILIWRVIPMFVRCFPWEWIYYDAREWAMAYNVRHYEIHQRLIEEDPFEESKPEYSQFAGP